MKTRTFTKEESSRYNGRGNTQAFIAYKGKVHDISESFLWQKGKHQVTHFAGKDLTEELSQAPHGPDLLERFPIVGTLIEG